MTECVVVTTPEDEATREVAAAVPGVRVFTTNAFTYGGARFNKGWALEQGFDFMGRDGVILIHDADVLLPDALPLDRFRPDCLHGARRRILEDPARWRPDLVWESCPLHPDGRAPIGFFQLFNAAAPCLVGQKLWYDVSFAHGGGSDVYFLSLFPPHLRRMLAIDVLHLGPTDRHWFGVDQAGIDMMARFVRENGWRRAFARHSEESAARAGEVVERVQVPGYPVSSFELPFVRRIQEAKKRGRA